MAENKAIPTELGSEKINKLLLNYAGPAIIAMTASSLYNMVDSIFIGHGVGPLAISGLAITFPLMNLSTAFGTFVGVGASTMLSVFLGQKNYDAAGKVLGNIVTLNTLIGFLFMAVFLIFLDPVLYFFGASESTLPYAREYMQIILAGNIITHLYFGLNNALRASGNPKLAMSLTIFTVVLNTILDPLFIFVFDLGIKGAAIATVISQAAALYIVFRFFNDRKRFLHFEKGIFKLDIRIAKDSLAIGVAPFLMNSAACLVTLIINQQLKSYSGDLAIGAYGIANRISFLFVMVTMGLNQGMQPIAGYNYGARQYSRVREVFKATVICATIVTTLGFALSEFLPHATVSLFTHDEELASLSGRGLQIMNLLFPIVGFQIVTSNLFLCLGMANKSIILSISRQILFLIPLLYILPMFFGDKGIWISFPVSDIMAFVVTVFVLTGTMKTFGKLKDGDDPSSLGSKL